MMRLRNAKTAFFNWLDFSIPDQEFRFGLVQALYSTPKSILGASVAAAIIIGIAAALSGDAIYDLFFIGFVLVSIARTSMVWLFRRTDHKIDDVAATLRWEILALTGAWAFATLVGITGAYTVLVHPGSDVEILIDCCVMGYIAGISSRNAARPVISIGQISLTCVPFASALLIRADLVHVVLAAFIAALWVSTIVICRSVFENIVSRQDAFRRIEVIAHRDSLTGLWNRVAFFDLLEGRLQRLREGGRVVALISIDLDRFKDINDTLGHPAGDAILRNVAERLRLVVGPGDEIARIGGDEFLVMLATDDVDEVETAAQRMLQALSDPFVVDLSHNNCGASIGYAVAPYDGATRDLLLRNADLALYEAKKLGRSKVVRYTEAIAERFDSRMALEHDLHHALARGELHLVYQPIVDPRSGRAICCEALLRWTHPLRGPISPAEFIPIAEATGLIVPIGNWVLSTACAAAAAWPNDISVAVNLSPVQFSRGRELVDIILATLRESGLPPERLELEVTESVLIEDTTAVLAVLDELRSEKVCVALDDFGTGFASLAYLNDFPFSKIKIDRKFSQNIESTRTAAIIRGVAKTARDLGIELIAEGIETETQLDHVRSFGINAVQGFLYSRPLRLDDLRRLIVAPIWPERGADGAATRQAAPRRKAAS